MKDRILLLSAGMDSIIAWHILGRPECLHITEHSKYSVKERRALTMLIHAHPNLSVRVIDMSFLRDSEKDDAEIPARNAYFALAAARYANEVYLPCQLGEQSIPDRSPAFFQDISALATHMYQREIVVNPVFPTQTKQDMVVSYLEQGYPVGDILLSMSCFSDKPGRCGRCAACFRTSIALDYVGLLPEGHFVEDIWAWDGISKYVTKMKAGEYDDRRAEQTKHVLVARGLWK